MHCTTPTKLLQGQYNSGPELNGHNFRSAQNAVLLKFLNDLNDIREWVLSLHFGSLTDFVQEMGQWSVMLRSDTLTSVNVSGLFVYYTMMVNRCGRCRCNCCW